MKPAEIHLTQIERDMLTAISAGADVAGGDRQLLVRLIALGLVRRETRTTHVLTEAGRELLESK